MPRHADMGSVRIHRLSITMSLIDSLSHLVGGPNSQPRPIRTLPDRGPAQDMSKRPVSIATGLMAGVMSEDARTEANRTRGNAYLHVSTLVHNPCPRKLMLLQTAEEVRRERHFSPDRIVHTLGRAAEHHVRTQYIESVGYSGVLGKWVCPCGETQSEPYFSPTPCRVCRKATIIYKELTLLDHDARIVGGVDFLIAGQDDLLVPVEIKSMRIAEFMERRGETNSSPFRPVAEHIAQVSAYHKLSGIRFGEHRMAPFSLIYYVAKDYPRYGIIPYATVLVDMQDEAPQRWQRDLWALARELWAARSTERLPGRLGVCTSALASAAKACECVGPCFLRD